VVGPLCVVGFRPAVITFLCDGFFKHDGYELPALSSCLVRLGVRLRFFPSLKRIRSSALPILLPQKVDTFPFTQCFFFF